VDPDPVGAETFGCHLGAIAATMKGGGAGEDVTRGRPSMAAGGEGEGAEQKRFIYRLLTRHGCLPVWLVADE
jgi:hypothetical protein